MFLSTLTKEVKIVYRLFLVDCYLLHMETYKVKQMQIQIIYMGGSVIHWSGLTVQYIAVTRNNLCIIWISLTLTVTGSKIDKLSEDNKLVIIISSWLRSHNLSQRVSQLCRNIAPWERESPSHIKSRSIFAMSHNCFILAYIAFPASEMDLICSDITIVFYCIVAWIQPDISGCQQDFLVVWRWNQLRTF